MRRVVWCCVSRSPNFSDATGKEYLHKDDVELPADDWYWLNEWEIEVVRYCPLAPL